VFCVVMRCEFFFPKKNLELFDSLTPAAKHEVSLRSPPFVTCFFPQEEAHKVSHNKHTDTTNNKSTMPYASESFLRTAAREGKKMWPFLAGFAFVGTAVTYSTLTITSEDKKASKFLNPGGH